ncbi:MAG: hypothetical protein ACRDJE_07915 [Dehalococcoidia bacterium]
MSRHDRPPHELPSDGEQLIERSVDEVAALHHGEWILLQVTERDDHHQPLRGIVFATGPTRRSIQPTAMAKLKESKQTGAEYYVFTGYRRLKSGQEWADALDEIVRQGMQRGRRRR